jgi:hypothetical protein
MGVITSRVKGRNIFQFKFISISYRNRGSVARNHRKIRAIMGGIINKGQNRIEVNKDIRMILAYSAKKIRAKCPPEYSTLNPDTSSDSPSAKSKGVRLTSAEHEIIHTINRGIIPIMNHNID